MQRNRAGNAHAAGPVPLHLFIGTYKRYLFICTGTFQAIISAPKTSESGGVEREVGDYTYYCAEEPTSIVPTACMVLIVEPGSGRLAYREVALVSCVRGRILRALSEDMALDMAWQGYARRGTL